MQEMSKTRKLLFLTAILFTTVAMMGDCLVTPAADTIYKFFDNEAGVNAFLSAPTIVAMFASIFFGALSTKVDKKKILLFGAACFTISGVFGIAIPSLPYMIFMRCVLGLALGACNVTSVSIIAQTFIDEKQRSRYTSFITAGTSLCGVILTLISGALAQTFGWQSVFYIHLVGIIMMVLIIFFVPKCPPIKEEEEESVNLVIVEENRTKWPVHLVTLIASQFVWYILYGIIFFQISIYVVERNIGNEAFSGAMASTYSLVAFLFCLAFSFVYSKVKYACGLIYYGLFTVGFLIMLFGSSRFTTVLACVLIGMATGTALSYFAVRGSLIVPREKMSMAVTCYSACMGIGMGVSTYVAMGIKAILGVDTFVGMLPALVVIAGIGTVMSLVFVIKEKNHPSKYYIEEN